jgi:hypothetical protein
VAHGLEAIDWHAPWLNPLRTLGQELAGRVNAECSVADALNGAPNMGERAAAVQPVVQFVPQTELPIGVAYEQYIFDTQRVPTRNGLHDFFNGLCWLHYPQTKSRLNQLQAAHIAENGIHPVRGPARDAITVFDENAAFFVGPDAVWNALVRKDWLLLFGALRPSWQEVQLHLFGHALLEKLVYPRKPITAHVFRAACATSGGSISLAELDRWVASSLSAASLASKPFAHLPVLGVPGWWPDNQEPGYYADSSVFRAARMTNL